MRDQIDVAEDLRLCLQERDNPDKQHSKEAQVDEASAGKNIPILLPSVISLRVRIMQNVIVLREVSRKRGIPGRWVRRQGELQ